MNTEACQYDGFGRMKYHPDFHHSHGKPYSQSDLEYICKFYEYDGLKSMSYAIGKTESTIANTVTKLKKQGLFEHYKKLNKYW